MTSAPAALLLVLFLASCAERTPPPAPLVLFPPESVFTPCEQPKLQGDTWGGYRQPRAGAANSLINLRRPGGHA
ncbi:Rz1-like lysis system protein LysC [Serratia ureilytica]